MKKIRNVVIFLFALFFTFIVFQNDSFAYTEESLTLYSGESREIVLQGVDASAQITWQTSNGDVAFLENSTSTSCSIKANQAGTAQIDAIDTSSEDGPIFIATYNVTVLEKPVSSCVDTEFFIALSSDVDDDYSFQMSADLWSCNLVKTLISTSGNNVIYTKIYTFAIYETGSYSLRALGTVNGFQQNIVDYSITISAHDWGPENVEYSPTCTEEGKVIQYCSLCSASKETILEPLGHSYEIYFTVDKKETCEEDGEMSIHCSKCSDRLDITTIPATGHIKSGWQIIADATCTQNGSKIINCTVCGKTLEAQIIKATGHTPGDLETIPATCTMDGRVFRKCTVCNETIENQILKATGHTPGEWETARATCTIDGYTFRKCTVCHDVIERHDIKATGHKYAWRTIKDVTCENSGLRSYECTVCRDIASQIEIPAIGHTSGNWATVTDATCTKIGKKVINCTVCGKVLQETEIPAAGHDFGNWVTVKEASYTAEGSQERTCKTCGQKETRAIAKLIKPETPTTEAPETEHRHKWSGWITTIDPQCGVKGEQERFCIGCKESQVKSIKALSHKYGKWQTIKKATIFSAGKKCKYCIYCSREVCKTIPKLKSKVTLNVKQISLKKGAKFSLKIASKTKNDKVKSWSVSRKGILTADLKTKKENIKLVAKKKGTTYVTVKMKSGVTAKCKITVK